MHPEGEVGLRRAAHHACKMEYEPGVGRDERLDEGRVTYIADSGLDARVIRCLRLHPVGQQDAADLEFGVLRVARDLGGGKRAGEGTADETGTAGDEDFH